jgi:thiol:disulfide interchange protein
MVTSRSALGALASIALLLPFAAWAAPPARMTISSFDQLARPLPLPYNETANANAQVAAARARAKRSHKLLLIDLGGNWCLDCRVLAGVMATEPLAGWLHERFEMVTVDVGRFDKNQQIQRSFGIKERLAGVPALFIVNPRSGKLLNAGHVTALADARSLTPQALADWFASWVR